MNALHIASASGSGDVFGSFSGPVNSLGPADDYAFFRSFAAAQAAQDPELAKLLGLRQAPPASQHVQHASSQQPPSHDEVSLCRGQQQQQRQPCNGTATSICAGGSSKSQAHDGVISACQAAELQQQQQQEGRIAAQPSKMVDSSGVVLHIVASADSPTAHQAAQQAAQQQEQSAAAVKAAVAAVLPSPAASALTAHRALTPDFTRHQIKSLRKLFPIQAPAVKSAAIQGEYQLLDLLGKGAFGAAYKARHLKTGQLFCIKTVETAGAPGQSGLEQQRREVAVLAALQHPNIIRYHDCFSDSSKLHIVMEWADGGDLQGLLQQHAKSGTHMPQEQLLAYFVQLVAALAHIHGAGVMHRDLKTNNIFLTSQGLLKIGDFGIAKVLDAPGAQSSSGSKSGGIFSSSGAAGAISAANAGLMAQSFVGTPNYLAPEQLGCGPYNQKADVWAIGCVLYEMVALRPAFKADRIPLIYRLIKQGRTPPLPTMYSEQLRALQQQLMAQDPWTRPGTAELLQHDLLRPHLEHYKQQLQQLGLELPPLPRAMYSSSGGSAVACSMPSATQSFNSSMEPASYLTLRLEDGGNLGPGAGIRSPDRPVQGLQPGRSEVQSSPRCNISNTLHAATAAAAAAAVATAMAPTAQPTVHSAEQQQLQRPQQQTDLAVMRTASHELECTEFRQQQLQHQQEQCLSSGQPSATSTIQGSSSSSTLALLCKCFKDCISCGNAEMQDEVSLNLFSSAVATTSAKDSVEAMAADSASVGITTSHAGTSTLSTSTDPSSSHSDSAQESLDRPSPLVFDEARLLPPLRRTLSTVLSSNISTVLSSNISTVFSSNLGSIVSSNLGSTVGSLTGAVHGSTSCTATDSTPCSGGGKSSNAPSSRSSRSTGELATSAQPGHCNSSSSSSRGPTPSRWTAMLNAAGLMPLGNSSSTPSSEAQADGSCNSGELHGDLPQAAATAVEMSHLCSVQQQQQHALQPQQLQHMHMLAERYTAQQQQQLCPEPSGLSTISERSESRTTPRGGSSIVHSTGHSFTSNFTVGEHEVALSPLGHGCEHQGMFSPRAWLAAHAVLALQAVQVPQAAHAIQVTQPVQAVQVQQAAHAVQATQPVQAVQLPQAAHAVQVTQPIQAVQHVPVGQPDSNLATAAAAAAVAAHPPVITAAAASSPAGSESLIQDVLNHQYAVAGHRLALAAAAAVVVAPACVKASGQGHSDYSSSSSNSLGAPFHPPAAADTADEVDSCSISEHYGLLSSTGPYVGAVEQQQQQQQVLEPCALREEQLVLQSVLGKLRVQLCYAPSRSAAASP